MRGGIASKEGLLIYLPVIFMVFIKELVVLMILIKCEQMTPIFFQKSMRNPLFIDFFHDKNSIEDLQ
jgi:hypothetical protein